MIRPYAEAAREVKVDDDSVRPPRDVDRQRLGQALSELLEADSEFVAQLSVASWSPGDGFLGFIYRATIRRQFDVLGAIVRLVEGGFGYAATPLLRPACEEFIWLKYLLGLDQHRADELLFLLARFELMRSIKTQSDYYGIPAMIQAGWPKVLIKPNIGELGKVTEQLLRFGDALRWPKNRDQKSPLPSIAYLASKTGEKRTYEFIYHATSRSVHFSTSELLRRCWSTADVAPPVPVSIGSNTFEPYWSRFAVYWGYYLYINSVASLHPWLEGQGIQHGDSYGQQMADAVATVTQDGSIPIVTPDELTWRWEY